MVPPFLRGDDTFVYAVQIIATAQSSPPQITLAWEPDPYGATRYTISRKTRDATSWGTGVPLLGSATSYTDTNVTVGSAYEYEVIKNATVGYLGSGYIYAGVAAPLTENRGTLVLIVASTYAGTLSNELANLESDLVGDGWRVIRHDVSSADSPANVRNLVIADYNADPNVRAVFLFGHVPVFRTGNLDYDGHGARPMPCDAFYGDIDGNWAGSPSFLPSNVELMVGRVDLFNMPGNNAPAPWPSEAELLRNYLRKDHQWRHKQLTVPRRALMGNRAGDFGGEAFAASGYRNFQTFVGSGNIVEANVQDNAPASARWISILGANRYLWAYGCGGGDYTSISQLGTHGLYNDVWSTDIVGQDAGAVFVMLYGSHFGEWDATDDFMRAPLATASVGLATCLSGRPHWFAHHLGLGEPIGFSARVTMNNSTLYQTQSNAFVRGIHIGLMGDPTLRLDAVAPPAALQLTRGSSGVNLSWSPASEPVAGYHVYRSASPKGPFSRLTTSLLSASSFTDTASSGTPTYMVRAVKLQVTPSGSYYNPSQGIFGTAPGGAAGTITTAIRRTGTNVVLTWNNQTGVTYRVLGKDNLSQSSWSDVSGTITTNGSTCAWLTSDPGKRSQRFYKIASP